ncbi:MAG: minor capsid protein, partial [Clostridia bacterium]|nr:minor capsid protein [Clostridia bacterium]
MEKRLSQLMAQLQAEVLFQGGVASRTQLWQYAKYRQLERELAQMTQSAIGWMRTEMDATLERVFYETLNEKVDEAGAGFNVVTNDAMRKYLNSDWAGVNYSTRVWNNVNALATRLKDDMADLLILGRSPSDIKRKIREDFGVGFYEADRLIRTEAMHMYNEGIMERYRRDGVTMVDIRIGRDERTCSRCNGYKENAPYPIDEAPALPAHPNCRCRYVPVVEWENKDLNAPNEYGTIEMAAPMRGMGAKAMNTPNVENPLTGEPFNYVYGKRPEFPPDHTMAGYGCKTGREID